MVDWQRHLIGGVILSLIFVAVMRYTLEWYELSYALIIVLLVSPLVPDLDHPMGKLHQWVMTIGFIIAGIGIACTFLEIGENQMQLVIVGAIIAGVTFFNAIWTKHRGFWHSIPMAVAYGLVIVWLVDWQVGILGAVGFWTHLLLDEIPLKIK